MRNSLKAAIRWSFLIDGIVIAPLSLLTVFKIPACIPWQFGLVVPEIALWLAPLPVCFALGAWVLRRKLVHRLEHRCIFQ